MCFEPRPITTLDTQDRRHTVDDLVAMQEDGTVNACHSSPVCRSVDALVAMQEDGTPVGLAAHPVYRFEAHAATPLPVTGQYTITHLLSSLRVYSEPVATQVVACTWLERIVPLTDWMHPAPRLRPQSILRLQVMLARVQAMEACDEDRLEELLPLVPNRTPAPPLTPEGQTTLIEWIIYAMEYLALPQEAVPALEHQLTLHAALVRASEGALQEQTVVSSCVCS